MQSFSIKNLARSYKPSRLCAPVASLLPAQEAGESIEAFLRRGGVIERLDPGARGQPVVRTFRSIKEAPSKTKKRAR